jgi:hypothetical protein
VNSAHATTPDTVSPTDADAVGAIVRGDLTIADSHGNATLISTTQVLTAAHVLQSFPFSSGYHFLPTDSSASARYVYFRRKTNGTAPVGGNESDYHRVAIAGYRIPESGDDIALCDLATAVTHIPPIPIDNGAPAASDELVLVGWGLDGATIGAGSRPNDARMIETRTISTLTENSSSQATLIQWSGTNPGPNLYDSGGAVVRLVDEEWKLAGVIVSSPAGLAVEQFKNAEDFQIAGLYEGPAASPTPAAPSVATVFVPTDTKIDSDGPTANNSAGTQHQIYRSTSKGDVSTKAVLLFDLASLGCVPASAELRLTLAAAVADGDTIMRVRRIRRTGTTHLAAWNTYDGTNNWGTAGAANTTTDVFTDNEFTKTVSNGTAANVVVTFDEAQILAMVNAARSEDGVLRLLIEPTQTNGQRVVFHTADASETTYRPKLVIESECTASIRSGARSGRAARITRT